MEERLISLSSDTIKNNESYELYLLKYNLKEEFNRRLDSYIETLTHDIKTPALAQLRAIEYLLKDKLSADTKEMLTTILESCNAQYEIIKNLINKMKYQQEEIILKHSYFNLTELIRTCLRKYKTSLLEHGNRVKLNIPPSEQYINADREKLSEALDKILNYSFTKTSHFTEINISLKENEYHSQILINIDGQAQGEICGFKYQADQEIFLGSDRYNCVGNVLEYQVATEIINAHSGSINEHQQGNSYQIEIRLPKI
ncbi:MAG: hypothetical protein NC390_07945 [Fusobacterium sp.]|nr:hypothetical protein [Fusobacterium sp.]